MPPSRLRLCLLQPESPPSRQEDADSFVRLAEIAMSAGHRVTQATVCETGISFQTSTGSVDTGIARSIPPRLIGPVPARTAYFVQQWLCSEPFDIVCAPARGGLLFYALNARHQGLALQNTAVCILADRPTLFARHMAGETPLCVEDVVQDEMERQTLALADLVQFTEAAAEGWAMQSGWRIPGLHPMQPAQHAKARAHAVLSACVAEAERRRAEPAPARAEELPLVSACIPHFNRPALLRQAIESLRRQTYPKLEIVVVDDASTAPEARSALVEIAADLARLGGRLVRHESNRYLGAARNTAVSHAGGAFVFFLDDDDYAKPEQIATLVHAALATGADIVNSLCDRLTGELPPAPDKPPEERWLTLGNAPAAGLFQNLFGTASALFRKTSFQRLGGFSELRGVGCEDWEIFARASLAGMNLQTVPQALYWYRLTPGSMIQTGNVYAGADRVLAVYDSQVPAALPPVLRFAHGAAPRLWMAEGHLRHCKAVLSHRDAVIAERDAELAYWRGLNQPNAALFNELEELRAVRAVLLDGYGATPQAAVDAVVRSGSWRAAGLLRAPLRWLTRRRADAPPRVTNWGQAATVIGALQRSSSWEVTGPLRALARLARRH